MAIDPKRYSNTLHLENFSNNFIDFPYSIMRKIFSAVREQLNELRVSEKDSLFSGTQNLLIQENDTPNTKAVKIFFHVFPVIPTVIGATFIIDNVFKVFKTDVIQELDKDLVENSVASEKLLQELTVPLHYFYSEDYKDLKTELDLNLVNVIGKHSETRNNLSEIKNQFLKKLEEVKPSLNTHLKQSKFALDNFRKIISEGKSFYERIEEDIESHRRIVNDSFLFLQPNITTISSEIILPFNLVENKILELARQINPEVQHALFSRIQIFKEKMHEYLNDLKKVKEKLDELEFKEEKECVEECLTVKIDSTEVTTCKSTRPIKENKYIAHLNMRKSDLKESIKNTARSYIKFLDKTYVVLKQDYMSAMIENNKKNLSELLINAKFHLDSYDAKFPKQEKREFENLIKQINTSTDIDKLISKSYFKYGEELRKCETLRKENSKLIEKTVKKLKELEGLSSNSSLKHKYKDLLLENSNSLALSNNKLNDYYNSLLSFQKELFTYNSLLNSLRLDVKKSNEEREYDELSVIYNKSCNEMEPSKKPKGTSEICSKIYEAYCSSQSLFFI